MADAVPRPTFIPALFYKDPVAALDFLERAFGFERFMVITDSEGRMVHAEMRFGDGVVMVGSEWSADRQSPASLDGRMTQDVKVVVAADIEGHCARAKAAGAQVTRELADEFYGDRVYVAKDLEGHSWSFGQTVRQVSRDEAEASSGLTIEGWV